MCVLKKYVYHYHSGVPFKKKKIIDTSDAGFFTGAAMMQLRRDDLQNVVAVQCMDRSRKMIGPLVDFK